QSNNTSEKNWKMGTTLLLKMPEKGQIEAILSSIFPLSCILRSSFVFIFELFSLGWIIHCKRITIRTSRLEDKRHNCLYSQNEKTSCMKNHFETIFSLSCTFLPPY